MAKNISRRDFIKSTAVGAAAVGLRRVPRIGAPFLRSGKFTDKTIILGIDGMDPNLLQRMIEEGWMPNFKSAISKLHFGKIQTTTPPHSPVAWSSFITGTDPGGHGIFDFVHRDPATFTPYMSTSRSFDAASYLPIGHWELPLSSGHVDLMRRGTPVWSYLERNNVPATVCQIPANFPVVESATQQISGMGTPDLLGTYGTFTYYTDGDYDGDLEFAGGKVVKVRLKDNSLTTKIFGPRNSFRDDGELTTADMTIDRDAKEPYAVIRVGDERHLLKEGEWSPWIPVSFKYLPLIASTAGMVRIYAKQLHPVLKLYVSPVNVDPLNASLPVSSPPEYGKELAEAVGRFYTQGFPADTKSLSSGIFTSEEFFEQAKIPLEESMRLFEYQLARHQDGVFYFYFSSVDQGSHMLMRLLDPKHPLYEANASEKVKNSLKYIYKRMDDALGEALSKVDSNTTLIVLSDHGFAPFTREFNVSSWLLQEGYTALTSPEMQEECDAYQYVDWKRTKVYALGLNGIYINKAGREKFGWVSDAEGESLKREIAQKLRQVTDPANGNRVIVDVADSKQVYSAPFRDIAPDLVVGYNGGYRISDEAVLGKFPMPLVRDRVDPWSADHCIHPSVVPGILLSNREVKSEQPKLADMAPSILSLYGIETPASMTGRSVF